MVEPIQMNGRLSDIDIAAREARLSKRGGGSDDVPPTGIESRLAKVEASTEHIESDIKEVRTDIRELRTDIKVLSQKSESNFRVLFGAIITACIGFLVVISRAFGWI